MDGEGIPFTYSGARERVFSTIDVERDRQEDLARAGRFKFTAANPGLSHIERLPMLTGELGEIATQIEQQPDSGLMPVDQLGKFDQRKAETGDAIKQDGIHKPIDPHAGTREGLRAELVQLAAIAVAWIEAIDGEGDPRAEWGSVDAAGEWQPHTR